MRKKPAEIYQTYIYRALEIASHVPDDETNKSVLYGAMTIKELKKRFLHYETQTNRSVKTKPAKGQAMDKHKCVSQAELTERYFNCRSKSHLSKDCPDKEKGSKCFGCGNFGNVASNCTNKEIFKKSENAKSRAHVDMVKSSDKKIYKTVIICGRDVTTVIDSGSDLHLVRASLYEQLNAPKLNSVTIPFDGVESENNRTVGRFEADIIVDELPLSLIFDVIPNDLVNHDLIIGDELSDHAEIKLKNGQMTSFPKSGRTRMRAKSVNDDPNWREVININVREEEGRGALADHVADSELRAEVR